MASTTLPEGKYHIKTTSESQYTFYADKIVVDTIGDIVTLYAGEEKTVVFNWSNIEYIIPETKTEE